MTVTYTIDQKTVEGNRRVHYGHFDMTSGDTSGTPVAIRSLSTGLRMVDWLKVYDLTTAQITSGIVSPRVMYPGPGSWPALDSTSGHFTLEFTSTATIYWEARGKS